MFNAYFDETSRRLFGMTGTADGDPREGRKWVVENFDPVSSVRYMRDGRLTTRQWFRSLEGIEEASWFAADDVPPFVAMIWWSMTKGVGRHIARSR